MDCFPVGVFTVISLLHTEIAFVCLKMDWGATSVNPSVYVCGAASGASSLNPVVAETTAKPQ
jgi:hypothetical protein